MEINPSILVRPNPVFEIYQNGCTACADYTIGDDVQAQIDAECTPLELYNIRAPLDSIYGKLYQGGIIFFLDVLDQYDFEGMVRASEDQGLQIWGCLFMNVGTLKESIGE